MTMLETTQIEYGSLRFNGIAMPVSLQAPEPNGPLQLYIDTLAGGLNPSLSPVSFSAGGVPRDSNGRPLPLIYFCEGAYGLHLGKLCLPYINTTQTGLITPIDHSGFRAANKRVHSINSELGAAGLRWYAGVGTNLLRDTSLTDSALVVADTLTNNVTAISHLCFGHTRYLAIGTDGTTDDIKGTTDPTASPPTWVTLVPLTSGDYVSGMALLPTLSDGINVFYGTINGVTAISFSRCADPLLTLPSPIDLSTGSVDPTVKVNATNAYPGTVVSDNDVGTVAWTNPGNAAALDLTYATAAVNAQTTEYLKCTNFGFAVPSTAQITGVRVYVYGGAQSAASVVFNQVRLVDDNDVFFGRNQAAAEPAFPVSAAIPDTTFFPEDGSTGDTWGVLLTPTIVNDSQFGFGVALRETAASNEVVQIDVVAMTVFYKEGTDYVSVTKSPSATNRVHQGPPTEATTNAPWANPGNVIASDNSDARFTFSAIGGGEVDQNSLELFTHDYQMGIPETATIRGIVVRIERAETNAAANAFDETIQLLRDLVAVGSNKANTTQELETTDTSFAYGEPDDLWDTTWTPAQVNSPGFGVKVAYELDANDIDIDHIQITVYYQMPTTVIELAPGGTMVADTSPQSTNRLWILAPVAAQTTAITNPRELYVLDLQWDETDDLPVGTLSKPYTGLPYVSHLVPFQGGAAIAGGAKASLFNEVKYISSGFEVRDLDFPPVHGTNAVTITALFAQGEFLVVDTAYTDGSEAQRWLYHDGHWYPEWSLQDKTSAISIEPLLFAEAELALQQGYAYRLYPFSTTELRVAREFVPPNLYADPLLVNTSIVKQDGPLYTQLSEMFPAQPENDFALMTLQSQSRFIDNDTSYGSLRVLIDTGGDRTIASAEVDKTFDAVAETFVDNNIFSSGDPGVAYKSLIIRLILNHQASSGETPDALPLGLFSVVQGDYLERFMVVLSQGQSEDIVTFINRLRTLKATKTVQRFRAGGFAVPAVMDSFEIEYKPTLGTSVPSWDDVKSAVMTFSRVPGSTS